MFDDFLYPMRLFSGVKIKILVRIISKFLIELVKFHFVFEVPVVVCTSVLEIVNHTNACFS